MQQHKLITLTNLIIAITIIMYIVQSIIPYGNLYMGLNFYFIEDGLWWQPLSSMFAHGGIGHLLMNMFVLYQFGNLVEEYRGWLTFVILYFVGGLLTSLFSFGFMVLFQLNHNLVGASGAISVVLGYIAFVDTYQRKGIVVWIVLISFAPLLIGLPVAWYAHLIGFVIGWIIGMIKK
mgnify:CR=1 FL=1